MQFSFCPVFRPRYPHEETEEETVIDDDAELTLNKVEEEDIGEDEEDEEEEHILGLEDLKKLAGRTVSDLTKWRENLGI